MKDQFNVCTFTCSNRLFHDIKFLANSQYNADQIYEKSALWSYPYKLPYQNTLFDNYILCPKDILDALLKVYFTLNSQCFAQYDQKITIQIPITLFDPYLIQWACFMLFYSRMTHEYTNLQDFKLPQCYLIDSVYYSYAFSIFKVSKCLHT